MKILGIDTVTKFLCIGIYDGTKAYEYNLEVGTRLSSLLGITIKRIFGALNWKIDDIDYFACGIGPGSFTGIRIGMATIKGLAWSLKKPILSIPSLDILAKNAGLTDRYIIPMVDAKRNLIYCSIYKIKNNTLKRISPYMLLSEKDFFKKIRHNAVIFGDAVSLYKEKIQSLVTAATILDTDCWYPKGHNIIELARGLIKSKKFNDAFNIKPIYLYPKECQIKNSN